MTTVDRNASGELYTCPCHNIASSRVMNVANIYRVRAVAKGNMEIHRYHMP